MTWRLDGKDHPWPMKDRRQQRWWEDCQVGRELPSHTERLAKIKVWKLSYNPNLTDGGWSDQCLIAVDCYPYWTLGEAAIRRVTILLAGEPIQFVMGSAATDGWHIWKSSVEDFEARQGEFAKGPFGGGRAQALFLSDGPSISAWPEPCTMNDLATAETLGAKLEHLKRTML